MPFARSDLAYVFVSAAHGGCGQPHCRPVVQGAPAKVWEVTCPQCSDHLRNDAHWSSTVSEIPETHDEALAREDFEKRGARDKDAIMTLALAKLAGVDPGLLPASLTTMVSGARAHVPETVDCPNGHPNAVDARFCSQCGNAIGAAVALGAGGGGGASAGVQYGGGGGGAGNEDVRVTVAEPPVRAAQSASEPPFGTESEPEHPDPPAPASAPPSVPWPSNTAMRKMGKDELAAVAKEHGVGNPGNRNDLLARLIEAANAAR